jgi:hypothetical protein
VDVEGQLGKLAIDQFYNQKFKKFFILLLGAKFIIRKCNLGNHKKSKFYLAPKIRSFCTHLSQTKIRFGMTLNSFMH